jgi:thymidylate synthase (FAD)
MQNLNEVSARYTELPDQFYLPDQMRAQDTSNKQGSIGTDQIDHELCRGLMNTAYKFAYKTYEQLLAKGVAKEMARFVLPVGIYTEVYSCWDLNNLMKFFVLRDDAHAQAEIQDFARAMKTITRELFPWTMEAYDAMRPLPQPIKQEEPKQPTDGTSTVIV